ncbi:hypothetical protein B0H19DRAFT_1004320 [Mycena capillaripes]|nr:hypothetical protein B0H19DRAFT_1004320 [Mycena capillaripes]
MKFTTAFFSFVAIAYAAPAPEITPAPTVLSLITRNQGSVYVCTDSNFAGSCTKFTGASGQCVNFSAQFNDDISAFGPDASQDCFFFEDGACSGPSFGPIRDPGVFNLVTYFPPTATHAGSFNDQLSSFKCFFG